MTITGVLSLRTGINAAKMPALTKVTPMIATTTMTTITAKITGREFLRVCIGYLNYISIG
jgi:hypothetical protein